MKVLNAILLLALAVLVGACTTVQEPKNRPEELWDSAYIHAVEEAARKQPGGMDVIWIRPPTAKDRTEDSSPD